MAYLSKYGVARHVYVPMIKRAVVDFAVGADWTPAAGDVKIAKDAGAAANVTNLPVAVAMGNAAMWDFSLTATEMQAAQVMVIVADSATKAVEDQMFIIETYGNASAQHALDLGTAISAQAVASVTGAVGSVTGAVGSVTARVTANTDQLAGQTVTAGAGVTFPSSVASPTNITAGTITTVTNLTNAATAGDLTATMKTSIGTAVAASAVASVTGNVGGNVTGSVGSVIGAVGSVTGNVGGNVVGTVASVVGAVGSVTGLTASNLDTTISSRLASAGYTAPDNTSITAIKVKTDQLVFGVANQLNANMESINTVAVNGNGAGTPWGP